VACWAGTDGAEETEGTGTTGALLAFCTGATDGVVVGTTGTTMEVVVLKLAGQLVTVGWQLVMTTSLVLKTVSVAGAAGAAVVAASTGADVWT